MDKKQNYKLRGIKSGNKQRIPWEARVDSFRQVHGSTYEYACKDYKNYRSKILVTCKKHGDFDMFISSHLKGAGCRSCKHENSKKFKLHSVPVEIRKSNRIENVIKANSNRTLTKGQILKSLHRKHSNKFTYDLTNYTNQKSIITLICPKHGNKELSVERILENKHGCPNCANINISHQEFEWLISHGVKKHQQKIVCQNKVYYVDGVDCDNKIVYEFLGEYWHGHPSEEIRTKSPINKRCKKPFKELFNNTEKRLADIMNEGYTIIYRWSKEKEDRVFSGKLEW